MCVLIPTSLQIVFVLWRAHDCMSLYVALPCSHSFTDCCWLWGHLLYKGVAQPSESSWRDRTNTSRWLQLDSICTWFIWSITWESRSLTERYEVCSCLDTAAWPCSVSGGCWSARLPVSWGMGLMEEPACQKVCIWPRGVGETLGVAV